MIRTAFGNVAQCLWSMTLPTPLHSPSAVFKERAVMEHIRCEEMKLVGMSRGWWSGLSTWGDVAWWCVSGRVGVVVAGVWWWVIFGHDREETPALAGSRS